MRISACALVGLLVSLLVHSIESQDLENLRCLICKQIVEDLEVELKKADPKKKVEVGNYRLDADGNSKHSLIPYALSEIHISESLEEVCKGIDDYVRASRKDTGELMLLKLLVNGGMNPEMSDVDIIQDGDLNKSLKYYCDGIVEDYEENIVKMIQQKGQGIQYRLCTTVAKLCKPANREDL